jgi:outer membrane murein-binding lipoprotein Lpp
MASTPAIRAEDNTLFEIDTELEAQFEAATNEEEQTGVISEEAKQRCLDLFAELGKKVDRIARYLRATEFKARAAKEEAARLTARQKTAENRVAQVKSMLAYYMLSRGQRRLEGELNTFRLQKNGQTALEIDLSALPQSYCLRTLTLTEPDWERILNAVTCPSLRTTLETSVVSVEPDRERIRVELQAGRDISGATLAKREHVRLD